MLSRREIEEAHERIRGHAHRTPVLRSSTFDRRFGAELFFKCENFQKVGAFKFRGAFNAVSRLSPEQLERGVTTHSSGNHAQALALAAHIAGTRARIVMPKTAPAVKLAAVRGYGAEVVLCDQTLEAREATVAQVIEETGATLVHPYDHRDIIAGQATAAKELIEDVPSLDLILMPVGGGGLASGTALAAYHFSPDTRVVGVEPKEADDAFRSLETGDRQPPVTPPRTLADGLQTALSDLTFGVLKNHLHSIVTVDEESIVDAMRLIWERMKIVVEPSGAVPFAAVHAGAIDVEGLRVGIILSGGNVDLGKLPWASG
ncbi:MAG: pyridoxal-phosphate dependent enzyme [bacterium]|nr:pyridoxal-phosphate dependent enzyme [bacterium]